MKDSSLHGIFGVQPALLAVAGRYLASADTCREREKISPESRSARNPEHPHMVTVKQGLHNR
jgi:hypothetical protein